MRSRNGWFAAELGILLAGLIAGLVIPYVNFAVLALCGWMILFEQDCDHVLDLLFFLLPLSPILKLDLHGFALYNLLLLLLLLRLMWENGFRFHFPNAAPVLLMGYLLAGFRVSNLAAVLRLICQLLIGMEVLAEPEIRSTLCVKRKNTMLALGILCSSGIALCRNLFPQLNSWLGTADSIRVGLDAYYYRFTGLEQNPNMYTVLLSVSLAVYCVYLLKKETDLLDFLLAGGLCLFGILSVSLSFVVTLVATLLLTGIFAWERNRKVVRVLLISLVLLGIGAGLLSRRLEFAAALLLRMQKSVENPGDLSGMTTGRWEIWLSYLRYFIEHPVMAFSGHGLGAQVLPEPHTHSYFLETVYCLGYLGGAIYFLTLYCVFAPSQYVGYRVRAVYHLPLLILLIRGLARNLICEEKLMMMYLLYTLTAVDSAQDNHSSMDVYHRNG